MLIVVVTVADFLIANPLFEHRFFSWRVFFLLMKYLIYIENTLERASTEIAFELKSATNLTRNKLNHEYLDIFSNCEEHITMVPGLVEFILFLPFKCGECFACYDGS